MASLYIITETGRVQGDEKEFSLPSPTLAIIATVCWNNLPTVDLKDSNHSRVALGDGATAMVFKTRIWKRGWQHSEGMVAVKQKRRQGSYASSERSLGDWLRSCLNDIRIGSHPKLSAHPNILEVLAISWEHFEEGDRMRSPCVIYPLADGGTLASFVKSRTFIGSQVILELFIDVLAGLKALHQYQVIHGDIKMDNVLLFKVENGSVKAKLSDFSHSIFLDDNWQGNSNYTGTRPFYIPEVRRQRKTNDPINDLRASDVYGLGVLLWAIFAGSKVLVDIVASALKCENWQEDVEQALEGSHPGELLRICLKDLEENYFLFHNSRDALSQEAADGFRDLLTACLADDPLKRGSVAFLMGKSLELQRLVGAEAAGERWVYFICFHWPIN